MTAMCCIDPDSMLDSRGLEHNCLYRSKNASSSAPQPGLVMLICIDFRETL